MPASLSLQPSKLGIGLPLQPSKLHPNLVKQLYARDRIPPSRHPQIAGFTARARRQAYQAQIRDLKTQYGYADTPVVLRDPAVLEQIALDASSAATSIINGYNSRLQSALETLDNLHKLRDTLSENDALLQPFRQGITDYNQDTLIPFQLKTARQAAIHDFMVNNGIQALYLVEPDYSVSPDGEICQQALAISNATDGKGAPFSAYAELSDGGFMGSEHPNCFIAGTMVAGPLVETAFSRPYQGPLVTIRTAGGDELTGTPNHPILTPEGWVPLGLLAEGHDLFRCTDVERMAHLIDPDEHQVPSLIEDVLGAEPVTLLQVPAATTNFHGDGMPDGKVDVVFPNRLLHRHGTAQQHRELALIGTGAAKDFAGSGVTQKSFLGMPSASNGFVAAVDSFRGGSRSDPAAQQVFLEGALRYTSLGSQDGDRFPSQVATNERVSDGLQRSNAGLQPSMGDQPRSLQVSRQDFLADPDLLRHSFDRFPGLIATDQVLDVRHHDGDTHVYNTSTAEGWYAANNIIVSNCPHLLVPKEADPDTLPAPEDLWDGSQGPDDVTTSEDMGDVSSEKGFVGLVKLLGLGMKTFNPDEPRDQTGKWTAGEAAAAAAYAAQTARTVADLPKPGSITPEGIPWTGTDQKMPGAQGSMVENALSGALAQRSGGKLTQHDAAYFQSFWSKDSTFPASVALEQAVGEKFGIPSNQHDAALREESAKIVDYAPFYDESQWNVGGWDGLLKKARAYVDAQYSLTQDMLKARGITEVEAYRGTKADEVPGSVAKEHDRVHDNYVPPMPDPSTGEVTYDPPKPDYLPVPITASPVSSWSASEGVANKFATDYGTSSGTFGLLQRAVIPASRVLAAAYTGSGSSDEYEYLIIGAAEPISVGMKLADDYVYRKRTGLGMVKSGFNPDEPRVQSGPDHGEWATTATSESIANQIRAMEDAYDRVLGGTAGPTKTPNVPEQGQRLLDAVLEYAKQHGIPVETSTLKYPYAIGGILHLLSGDVRDVSTRGAEAAHELGHVLLHTGTDALAPDTKNGPPMERQAELFASVVTSHYRYPASEVERSASYVVGNERSLLPSSWSPETGIVQANPPNPYTDHDREVVQRAAERFLGVTKKSKIFNPRGLGLVQKSEERSPEENAAIHAWYGDQATATAALGKIMTGVKTKYEVEIQKSPTHWDVPTIEGDTPAGRELYASMKAAAEAKGIMVVRYVRQGEIDNGYFDTLTNEIHINPDRPPDQQAKTLAHEVAHAYADHVATNNKTLSAKQEIEAEVTAFTLAQQHGLDTSGASLARLLGEGSRYSLGYGTNNIHQAIASVEARAPTGMKIARSIRRVEVDLKTAKSATVKRPKPQPDVYRYDASGKLLNPEDFHGCVRSSISSKGLGFFIKYNHDHDELGRFTSGDSELTSSDDPKGAGVFSRQPQVDYQALAQEALGLPYMDIQSDGQNDDDPEGTTADEVAQRVTKAGLSSRSGLHPKIVEAFQQAWQAAAYRPTSVALSEAVWQKFNLPQTPAGQQYVDRAKNDEALIGFRYSSALRDLTDAQFAEAKVAAWDKLMGQARSFVDAQYAITQETFDRLGYAPTDTIDLYRGFGKPTGQELANQGIPWQGQGGKVGPLWTETKITGRGATSWTSEVTTSENFVGMGGPNAKTYDNSYIAHAKVPIKDILATGFTGLGSMGEYEMVVLGGPRRVRAIRFEGGSQDATGRYTPSTMSIYTSDPRYAQNLQAARDRATKGLRTKFNHIHDELGRFAAAAGEPIPAPTPDGAEVGTKWYADVARKVSYVPPSLRDSEALSVLTPLDKGNNLISFARDHGISLRWTDAPDRIAEWDFKTTSSSSIQLAEAAREKWNLPQTPEGARRLASVAEGPLRTIRMENAREFVDAQYAFTQAKLAEAGYKPDDTVILYRGFGRSYGHGVGNLTSDDKGLWTQGVSVNTRGLSSWSATFDSARSFATPMYDHSYVMAARVKVSDIVSLAGTGLGVTHEREVVVKGGPRTGAIVERNLTTAGPNYDGGSDWYPRERATAEQQDLQQRYNAWLSSKKAHDVSDEARDDHGRWALGSVTAGAIPTHQEGQKAVEDYASTLYERSGGPYPDPYNGPQLTYEGIANSLDLPALNETRGSEIIAASNGKLSPVEVRAWANAWGRGSGGQEWAALQVATGEKFGVPLGTAEGRVATQAPSRDQIDQARVFVDATYEATQKVLKAQGVDFVDLYRGVGYTDAAAPATYQEAKKDGMAVGPIPNKPLASYAIDPGITEQFGQNYQGLNPAFGPGGRPYTLAVRVPRARIFGCAYAGIGVPREGEYVIIGGPTEALVKTRRSRYGN